MVNIVLFAPDSSDQAVHRRVYGLQSVGGDVTAYSFRRQRYNRDKQLACKNIPLGVIRDGNYLYRAVLILTAILKIFSNAAAIRKAEIFYARNLDMLFLLILAKSFFGAQGKVIYEVLDIRRIQTGTGIASSAVRLLEKFLLNRVDSLVVSSRKFLSEWYQPLLKNGSKAYVLENKLHRAPAVNLEESALNLPPIVIGWFGTLRCIESLTALIELAKARPDRIKIKLAGVPSRIGEDAFLALIAGIENIEFCGPYDASKDLPLLYQGIHFNWVSDFSDKEVNSKWLLPNRIYEGGFFQVPAIAVGDSYCSDYVIENVLGVRLPDCMPETLLSFFDGLESDKYSLLRTGVTGNRREQFVDNNELLTEIINA